MAARRTRLHEAGRLAAMGKAVSGLAHDLKTPLIAIGGFSRLIHRNLEEDSPHREKLGIIVEEVQRLERMIKEMLDFSRPLELHRSHEDMSKVISQSLAIVSNLAQEGKVRIEWQSSQNLPLISFDAARMKQALINLLINAIETSPEGETVTVSTYQKGRKITIDVSDHGCGIPVDKKEEFFPPFLLPKRTEQGWAFLSRKRLSKLTKDTWKFSKIVKRALFLGLGYRMKVRALMPKRGELMQLLGFRFLYNKYQ